MDGYDNDWLFMDDDLFMVLIDEYCADCREIEQLNRKCAMQRLEDEE